MNWMMTTRNWQIATNKSSLNLDRQGTQQVSPCLIYADQLYLLWRDLWNVHYVPGTVALGAVGFEDRVE